MGKIGCNMESVSPNNISHTHASENLLSRYEGRFCYTYVVNYLVLIESNTKPKNIISMSSKSAIPNPSEFADRLLWLVDSMRRDQTVLLLGESTEGRANAARSILQRIVELSAKDKASAIVLERVQQVQPICRP